MEKSVLKKIIILDPQVVPLVLNHFLPFLQSYYNHSHEIILQPRLPDVDKYTGCALFAVVSAALIIRQIIQNQTLSLPNPQKYLPFFSKTVCLTLIEKVKKALESYPTFKHSDLKTSTHPFTGLP